MPLQYVPQKAEIIDSSSALRSTMSHVANKPHWQQQQSTIDGSYSSTSTSLKRVNACPCCNRSLSCGRQTLGETVLPPPPPFIYHESLLVDESSDDGSSGDLDEQDCMLPGLLTQGTAYHLKKILIQGWVYKKGTGQDWMGSRAWKPRWASLVLGKVAGYEVDVPLLLIYWHNSSPLPSTVILLDSTVILPQDDPDDNKWNCFRFSIRHVRSSPSKDESEHVTRTFCCPREGRDAWVYSINEALLGYEKEKAKARKKAAAVAAYTFPAYSLPCSNQEESYGNLWAAESFPSPKKRNLSTPPPAPSSPTSPRSSSPKRPLPRPDVALVGVNFIEDIVENPSE